MRAPKHEPKQRYETRVGRSRERCDYHRAFCHDGSCRDGHPHGELGRVVQICSVQRRAGEAGRYASEGSKKARLRAMVFGISSSCCAAIEGT